MTRSLPATVRIGPYAYPIRVDADELVRYEHAAKSSVLGCIRWMQRDILIDPNAHHRAVVLLHEVLHGCNELAGTCGLKHEEQIVTALAPILLDTLRRNPDLVTYLTEE